MGRVRVFYGHEGVVPPTGLRTRPAAAPAPEVEEVAPGDLAGAPIEFIEAETTAEGDDLTPAVVELPDGSTAPVGEDGIPVLEPADDSVDAEVESAEGGPDDSWTKGDLLAYADDHGIDMTGATKTKPAALARVLEAIKEA